MQTGNRKLFDWVADVPDENGFSRILFATDSQIRLMNIGLQQAPKGRNSLAMGVARGMDALVKLSPERVKWGLPQIHGL